MAAVPLAAMFLGDFAVPVPLSFHPVAVPLALLLPLALSTASAYSLTSGDEMLEAVSSRPIRFMDCGLIGAVTVLAMAALLAIDQMSVLEIGAASARNAAGFVGLMFLGRSIVGGNAASLVPVAYAMFAIAFGTTAAGHARWWAWLLAPGSDGASWLFALALLIGGIATAASIRGRFRAVG